MKLNISSFWIFHDPEADDFQNLVRSPLSKDTSLIKFLWISGQ